MDVTYTVQAQSDEAIMVITCSEYDALVDDQQNLEAENLRLSQQIKELTRQLDEVKETAANRGDAMAEMEEELAVKGRMIEILTEKLSAR